MLEIKYSYIAVLLIALTFVNCTETYKLETNSFEKALVVEATLTNELRNHIIKISQTYKLEDSITGVENNAQVWIEDSNDNTFYFSENGGGVYTSNQVFNAQPNVAYKLFITTSEGKQFESSEQYLTPEAEIQNLYAEKQTLNENNGIQVFVDSNNDTGDAIYFRYEYEETHKVVTPFNIIRDIELINIDDAPSTFSYDIVTTGTEEEKRIGYITNDQKDIIQTSLINSSGNNIKKFPIRFIKENDHIIRERYSILVKQYVQTHNSYNFYQTLKELGSFGNLLTENQPGFVRGNINSKSNEKEKVVGFFDVSSVSKKRIYFSHFDFDLYKPAYPYLCQLDTFDYNDNTNMDEDRNDRAIMYNRLKVQSPPWELLNVDYMEIFNDDFDGQDEAEDYLLIPLYVLLTPECGNCNSFSSNIKPEFWED